MSRQPKTGSAALELIKDNFEAYKRKAHALDYQCAERHIVDNAKPLRVEEDGTVVWELFLAPTYHHVAGALHGGSAALILDHLTSMSTAPHSHIGNWTGNGGVTRTFTVTCLKPARLNTTVHIRCKVINIGKSALLLHGSIVSPDGKELFNTMEHNKINVAIRKVEQPAKI